MRSNQLGFGEGGSDGHHLMKLSLKYLNEKWLGVVH